MGRKFTLLIIILVMFTGWIAAGQTLTELVVPQYMGSKTAASTNNARTAIAVCFQIDGLVAATSYNIRIGFALTSEASTSYGAGNIWDGTAYTNAATPLQNVFTTNSSGSSGPFWLYLQPTGNGTRFDGGQVHNLRIGYCVFGGTMPSSPNFITAKTITCLDIAVTPRTPATTDDGCFVKGSAMPVASGKIALLFDNVSGTGNPLFSYPIRQAIPTQSTNTELPTPINDVYMQAGTSAVGDYPAVIPIGANNPNGVRRVEARNADNTVFAFNTDADGIWPSGANTTTPARRDVVYLTNTDTPLTPGGPSIPTVITDPNITNITFNSATGGGNVTGDGGGVISARGLCYGITSNPTVSGTHTIEPGTTGVFTSNMTGLTSSTLYHVRAYATNSAGTGYGTDVTFTTQCDPLPPVSNFTANHTVINIGDTVNFTDLSAACPTAWNWSFVGGIPMTSTVQNPSGIVYNYPGLYTVCLTTSNNWGSNTKCVADYITVIAPESNKIVITEIMYNPPEYGTDSLEFIELYNNDSVAINLENFHFSAGVSFTFPNFTLPAGNYTLVAANSAAMMNTFGVNSFQYTGNLSNNGELILLKNASGATVDSVFYDDVYPWDTLADGRGPSLELCNPDLNNALPQSWTHSTHFMAVNAMGDSIYCTPGFGCPPPPAAPSADFYAVTDTVIFLGGTVSFADGSSGNITEWYWNFEGGDPVSFSGQNPPPVAYNFPGSFDALLLISGAGGQSTKYRPDYIHVGISGVSDRKKSPIRVYPNPTYGTFTLVLPSSSRYRVRVLSAEGIPVINKVDNGDNLCFDLTSFAKGFYTIQVTDLNTGNIFTNKLILK